MGWREAASDHPRALASVWGKSELTNASVETEDRAIAFVDDMNLGWLATCWVTESGPRAEIVG